MFLIKSLIMKLLLKSFNIKFFIKDLFNKLLLIKFY